MEQEVELVNVHDTSDDFSMRGDNHLHQIRMSDQLIGVFHYSKSVSEVSISTSKISFPARLFQFEITAKIHRYL